MSEQVDLDRDELLTTNQAARLVGTHVATLYRWVLSGRLRAWKRGGRLVVRKADLQALLVPVVPQSERPREQPTAAQQREADRWTQEMLREAGWGD